MEYDLRRMGPLAFEQMVQALVVAEYGAKTVQVFGKGPDGGREAIIQGNGKARANRTIVQAKWVDVSDADADEGANRFLRAMRTELQKWPLERSKSEGISLKKPRVEQRILFVTNAVLSPYPDKGGLARFETDFANGKLGTSLNVGEVWHYSMLCALLDNHKGVRDAYLAATFRGDLRALVRELVSPLGPHTEAALWGSLASEMTESQHLAVAEAKLPNDDAHLRLTDAFIEIPVSQGADGATEARAYESQVLADDAGTLVTSRRSLNSRRPGAYETLVRSAENVTLASDPAGSRMRMVLVGGPGQGKTTISKFLVQVFRRELMASLEDRVPSPKVKAAMDQIEFAQAANSLIRPRLRRWPFRVVLSDFAKHLKQVRDPYGDVSHWKGPSLLQYLRDETSDYSGSEITTDDLIDWMTRWPVLFVLDGMDETPIDKRAEIVRRISRFEELCDAKRVDLALVVTTRPQANGTDFDPEFYEHVRLAQLTPIVAHDYANRLLELRYQDAPKYLRESKEKLESAMDDDGAGRLFVTPLQVAILVTLIRQGDLPQTRFGLFDEYFDAILKREQNKPAPTGAMVRRETQLIQAVHRRVGLLLQLRAERSRGAEAYLTDAELRRTVEGILDEQQVVNSKNDRTETIMGAIKDRLVFLVADVEERWTFEVVSLREYMAARALVDGEMSQDTVRDLFRQTVSSTHWRNVWLLGAGAAFTKNLGHRDMIMAVIGSANSMSALMVWARPAASIATDLLAEATTSDYPVDERALVPLALTPSSMSADTLSRLAETLLARQRDPELGDSIRFELTRLADDHRSLVALTPLLVRLANGAGPLRTLAEELLSTAPRSRSLSLGNVPPFTVALSRFIQKCRLLPSLSASEAASLDELQRIGTSDEPLDARTGGLDVSDALAAAMSSLSFSEGFASLLRRLTVAVTEDSVEIAPLLLAAESVRDRTLILRALAGEYLIVKDD